jgi:hypothetical protein
LKSTGDSSRKTRHKEPSRALVSNRAPAAILRRLDIDPAEVRMCPTEPGEMLTRVMGTGVGRKGHDSFPRQKVLAFAAVSNHPLCIAFTNAVRDIRKSDLNLLSFEAMCVRARVSPVELLGPLLLAAKSMKGAESALKAILAHPDVVQATIDNAQSGDPIMVGGEPLRDKKGELVRYRGDVAAQRLVHEFSATRFLPVAKGGGVEINFGFGRPQEEREQGDPDADQDWDDAFPDMGEMIQECSGNRHKMLEAGK